jgi:UDP-glucose 4-epimerase
MILVTGGLGYIGSHTVVKLIENGYDVLIMDNLVNSNIQVLDSIEEITGIKPNFFKGDVRNVSDLITIFERWSIDSVIHFAAFKSVKESLLKPLEYYTNNVSGTINLLTVMKTHDVKDIIFSSSCTVYGEPDNYPVTETTPIKKSKTPYGTSKIMCEHILEDTETINSIALRYFNPIGNHKSGLIYENPNGVPENLIPYIVGVITGEYEHLRVFGDDYETSDGTAIRDYINVNDLAEAHVKALDIVGNNNHEVINVGTGNGNSVMEIINAFKEEDIDVPYKILPRRDGDICKIWSDTKKSKNVLNWEPKFTLNDSVKSIIKKIRMYE